MPSIIVKQFWMTGWTGGVPPPTVTPTGSRLTKPTPLTIYDLATALIIIYEYQKQNEAADMLREIDVSFV